MEFTGERFTPECGGAIAYEHLHRYHLARSLVRGLSVADVACGEGYGSALMAEVATLVWGIDADFEAVVHAKKRYGSPNLGFTCYHSHATNLGAATFDAVVSFETIEHVEKQAETLAEFKRILKPNGFLLISTPNPLVYSPDGPHNPHHKHEMGIAEFRAALKGRFENVAIFGQVLVGASLILADGTWHPSKMFHPHLLPLEQAKYFVAIATDGKVPNLQSTYYDSTQGW